MPCLPVTHIYLVLRTFYASESLLKGNACQLQALQNMYDYLLEAESQLGSDTVDENVVNCSQDSGSVVPVAAGAGDTNICGGIVQLYWKDILERCLDMNEQVRQSGLKVMTPV